MAEVLILWTIVAVKRLRRALKLRRPAHARHRGSLTVDAVLDNRWAETVDEIVEEYRTGEIPRIPADHFAEWDTQLGMAVDLYAHEVAPIAAQLQEPADYVELDGERVSYDDLCSFTFGWTKTADGWKATRLAGASA